MPLVFARAGRFSVARAAARPPAEFEIEPVTDTTGKNVAFAIRHVLGDKATNFTALTTWEGTKSEGGTLTFEAYLSGTWYKGGLEQDSVTGTQKYELLVADEFTSGSSNDSQDFSYLYEMEPVAHETASTYTIDVKSSLPSNSNLTEPTPPVNTPTAFTGDHGWELYSVKQTLKATDTVADGGKASATCSVEAVFQDGSGVEQHGDKLAFESKVYASRYRPQVKLDRPGIGNAKRFGFPHAIVDPISGKVVPAAANITYEIASDASLANLQVVGMNFAYTSQDNKVKPENIELLEAAGIVYTNPHPHGDVLETCAVVMPLKPLDWPPRLLIVRTPTDTTKEVQETIGEPGLVLVDTTGDEVNADTADIAAGINYVQTALAFDANNNGVHNYLDAKAAADNVCSEDLSGFVNITFMKDTTSLYDAQIHLNYFADIPPEILATKLTGPEAMAFISGVVNEAAGPRGAATKQTVTKQ